MNSDLSRPAVGTYFQYPFLLASDTDLQLSLTAQKAPIDSLRNDHPRLTDNANFSNGIAVVAKIESISSFDIQGEGIPKSMKVGEGKLRGGPQ